MIYRIWKSKTTETYFLYDYHPKSNISRGGVAKDEVYNFKLFGHHRAEFKDILEVLKDYFGAETAVGVPSASLEEGNIQKISDDGIVLKPFEVRKRRREGGKLENERERIEIITNGNFKRVLLVDDICTTGKTLETYEAILRDLGVENVTKFAFGHKQGDKELELMIYIKQLTDWSKAIKEMPDPRTFLT